MENKICSNPNCAHNGNPQPLDNFANDKSRPSGKYPSCKSCRKASHAKNRVHNLEVMSVYNKAYYKANKNAN